MTGSELEKLLDAEVDELSRRSHSRLAHELSDVLACERGDGASYHQSEAQMIENEPDYVHIVISIDDGSLLRSIAPISRSFIVHRDGRVEI